MFIILCPDLIHVENNWQQGYGGSGFIYKDIRALYRTQRYLQLKTQLNFPICYRQAINKVYDMNNHFDEPDELEIIHQKYLNEQEGSFYNAKWISNSHSRPLTDIDPRSALLTREGELAQSVVLFKSNGKLLHGGDFNEQYDREKSSVSLSKKLAKGIQDEQYYCLKATQNEDINYSHLGVFDQQLVDDIEAFSCVIQIEN